ncbi:MAG TPA: DUF4328 domain-containing protein [Acidimicrobiales bacterium]
MSDSWQGPGWRRAEDGKWYEDPNWVDPAAPPPPVAPPAPIAPPAPMTPAASAPPPPPPTAPAPAGASSLPLPPPPAPTAGWPPPPQAYPATPGAYAVMPPVARPLSARLVTWVQGIFWCVAALSVLSVITAMSARGSFESYMQTSSGFDDLRSWQDAEDLFGVVMAGTFLFALVLFVLLIVWTFKSHKAAEYLQPGPRKWSRGWAVGSWFIPFASIVLPKLVIDETERIATAPRHHGVAQNWKATRPSVIGWVWWGLFIVSNSLVSLLRFQREDIADSFNPDRGQITGQYVLAAVGFSFAAAGCVVGALYVRQLSRRLTPAGLYTGSATVGSFGAPTAPGYGTAPTVMGGPSVASVPSAAVDVWATATASADVFCEICREPLAASSPRCPRCGKRRQPTVTAAPGPASPPPPPPITPPPYPPGMPAKEPASAGKIVGTIAVSFLLLVLVCLVAVTFLGKSSTDDDITASTGGSTQFSDVQHKAIVDGCVSGGGTRSQCECVFDVIDDMYEPEDLVVLEAQIQRGGYPAELTRVIQTRCI